MEDFSGEETFDIEGNKVRAKKAEGDIEFPTVIRINTPQEKLYYQHGGILQYVLRKQLEQKEER